MRRHARCVRFYWNIGGIAAFALQKHAVALNFGDIDKASRWKPESSSDGETNLQKEHTWRKKPHLASDTGDAGKAGFRSPGGVLHLRALSAL